MSHSPAGYWSILGLGALVALAGAFCIPLLSFFIIDGLQAPPYAVGVFNVSVAVSGMLLSQWLGGRTDAGWPWRRVLSWALLAMAIATALLMVCGAFWQAWLIGITLMALGQAAMPQTLALARRFTYAHPQLGASFSAQVRAAFSLAWIGGPPLAFYLVAQGGFASSFLLATLVSLACLWLVRWGLPNLPAATPVQPLQEGQAPLPPGFWGYLLAISCAAVSNSLYVGSLPLYLLHERHLPATSPGWAMGLAAGLEIPVMLLASRLAGRWGVRSLLWLGSLAGVLFYLALYQADSLWQVLLCQLANGLFFGLYAGLGILLIQDMVPHRPGFASACYSNSMRVGGMVGAMLMGLVASVSDFRSVLLVAAAVLLLGMGCLGLAHWQSQRGQCVPA